MRCPFQEGDFPGPVKYGYAAVGRIVEGPAEMSGRTVFVLHPHQTQFVVPATAAIPLPKGLMPERAVLAANMETALNGLWDAAIMPGDRVCVIGAGVVGLLVAWLASRIPGVLLVVHDIDDGKRPVAEALGLTLTTNAGDRDPFDVILHASGNPLGLLTALEIAGFEALIVEMSWFGDREVRLPLGEAFHSRRLVLRSSQVGAVAPSRRGRHTRRSRLELALHLLCDDAFDHLISGESPFESLPEVMENLSSGALPALCHRIRY
jgi:threonine dehydrogenase-like Zn-dependent dehydrogenase